MTFNHIDINSCLHEEMSPYRIKDNVLTFPMRFYDMYFADVFEYYDIGKTNIISLTSDNSLMNSKGQVVDLTVDDLRLIQRETFYIDRWYPVLEGYNITFGANIINISIHENICLRAGKIKKSLLRKIDNVMNANKDVNYWFPRLNSVSPKDAYMTGKDLKYNNAKDIVQRLLDCDRTNNFLQNDPHYKIVLRPWYDLPSDMEFRCFVRKGKLRAISQYDCYVYYPSLQDSKLQDQIKISIKNFYHNIRYMIPFDDYVMDVVYWVDAPLKSYNNHNVFIIEFNQFGGETACGSCLYNWSIDYNILYHSKHTDFRILDSESPIDTLSRELDNI